MGSSVKWTPITQCSLPLHKLSQIPPGWVINSLFHLFRPLWPSWIAFAASLYFVVLFILNIVLRAWAVMQGVCRLCPNTVGLWSLLPFGRSFRMSPRIFPHTRCDLSSNVPLSLMQVDRRISYGKSALRRLKFPLKDILSLCFKIA